MEAPAGIGIELEALGGPPGQGQFGAEQGVGDVAGIAPIAGHDVRAHQVGPQAQGGVHRAEAAGGLRRCAARTSLVTAEAAAPRAVLEAAAAPWAATRCTQ